MAALEREGAAIRTGRSLSKAKKVQPGRPKPNWRKEGGVLVILTVDSEMPIRTAN